MKSAEVFRRKSSALAFGSYAYCISCRVLLIQKLN